MDTPYHTKQSMPFFAWQCMSIKLHHREVDIVVHDEKEQNNLVKYILYKINTIDGIAGSADKILTALENQGIENYRKTQ